MPNTAHEVRWCGRGVDRTARSANFASKFEDVSERKAVIAYAKAATGLMRLSDIIGWKWMENWVDCGILDGNGWIIGGSEPSGKWM